MVNSKIKDYIENVNKFLELKLENADSLITEILETEPDNRVVYQDGEFKLGMAVWPEKKVLESMSAIQTAVRNTLDDVVQTGRISEKSLKALNAVSHDLKIVHFYAPEEDTNLKLGYDVPDSRLAWEEGKCPHCGETVTIALFPDPIPIIAYEAIINALRLLDRSVILKKDSQGNFVMG